MVKVTLATVRRASPVFETLHLPALSVEQDELPLLPLLQFPVTVTPDTGWWLASCTKIVTVAFQRLLAEFAADPSRSPTCNTLDCCVFDTVTVFVSAPVWPIVSVATALTACDPSATVVVFHETE